MEVSKLNFIKRTPRNHDVTAKSILHSVIQFLSATTIISGMLAASIVHAAQPNIVYILADDLDVTTSEYWERATSAGKDDPLKKTRALIKDKGMTFTGAFAPTPICCPARSTILSGKLGHNTGVLTNAGDKGGWKTFQKTGSEAKTMAVWLKNAGYRTALIGKYLNGIDKEPKYIPPGWSEWYGMANKGLSEYYGYNYNMSENSNVDGTTPNPVNGQKEATVVHYGRTDSDYSTDVIARKTVDFINRAEANDDQPFFIYVAPTAPHLPLRPARRHFINPYSVAPVPKRPNFMEADLSDKPAWMIATSPARLAISPAWTLIDYPFRQGSLYALDDLVESVVKTLIAKGEIDNTYIIFTSDNGYNLGAHGLIHKMVPYEESIRVPLVIRGPGIAAGSTRSQMILETDIAPTVAQWAGLPIPDDVDGRALQPLLGSTPPSTWRTDFLMQYYSDGKFANGVSEELPPEFAYLAGQDVPTYSALRNDRYKYVMWTRPFALKKDAHAYELYDLQKDPYELDNLLTPIRPLRALQNKALAASMKARMDQLLVCKGASCR
jgi:N-acetylglucosamine-6-sulfatase